MSKKKSEKEFLDLCRRKGDEAAVRKALEKQPELASCRDTRGVRKGYTPLHYASYHGREKVARVLLEHSAEVNAQNNDGSTPLHLASRNGHETVVRLLLEHGAEVNAQDNYGRTPLHRASLFGREKVARLVLEHGAEVNAQDIYGRTPLHRASLFGHEKVARLLLEHGADRSIKDKNGETARDVAKFNNKPKIVALLDSFTPSSPSEASPAATPAAPSSPPRPTSRSPQPHSSPAAASSSPSPSRSQRHSQSPVDDNSTSTKLVEQVSDSISTQVNARLAECIDHALHETTTRAHAEADHLADLKEQVLRQAEDLKRLQRASVEPGTAQLVRDKHAALQATLVEAERKHHAALQREHIRATPQLECYYEGLKLLLNSCYVSAMAMAGGFTQLGDGSEALKVAASASARAAAKAKAVGQVLDKVAAHVPFAGALLSLLGAGLQAADEVVQRQAIRAVAGMASSAGAMEAFVEQLARELTLDQEAALCRLRTGGSSKKGGWFARKLKKLKKKAQRAVSMSPVDMLPEALREKVKRDAGRVLAAVVAGELSVPVCEAVLPKYVARVVGRRSRPSRAAPSASSQRQYVSWTTQRAAQVRASMTQYQQRVSASAAAPVTHAAAPVDDLRQQVRTLQDQVEAQQRTIDDAALEQDSASAADVAALQKQLKRMAAELSAVKKKVGDDGDASRSGGGQMQLSARPEDVERVESVKVNLAHLHYELSQMQLAMSELAQVPERLDNVESRVEHASSSSSRRFAFLSVTHEVSSGGQEEVAALHERLAEQERRHAEQERRHAEELAEQRRRADEQAQQQAARVAKLEAMMQQLAKQHED